MNLWEWASAAYGRDDVAEAGLDLQDGYDQNVPYLLWAAWSAVHGRFLDADALEAGADTCRVWDETAVAPLRAIRRTLKTPIPDMGDAAREAVRDQVKAAELAAERHLLEDLETLAPAPAGGARPLGPALIEAARAWARVLPRAQIETLAAALSAIAL